jgi:hypothetical protein
MSRVKVEDRLRPESTATAVGCRWRSSTGPVKSRYSAVAAIPGCALAKTAGGPDAVASEEVLLEPVRLPSACSLTKSPDGFRVEIVLRMMNWLWKASIP